MYFSPDIILSFFIVAKGIVSDRNVLFIAIWGISRMQLHILYSQEIDKFWGKSLW